MATGRVGHSKLASQLPGLGGRFGGGFDFREEEGRRVGCGPEDGAVWQSAIRSIS